MLGDCIRGASGSTTQTPLRGRVDNASPSLLQHQRNRPAARQKRSGQVHGQDTIPQGQRHICGRCHQVHHACIIAENIQASVRRGGGLEHPFDIIISGDVRNTPCGLSALCLQCGDHLLKSFFHDIDGHDSGTFCNQLPDERTTDTRGSTGDQCNLILKAHRNLLCTTPPPFTREGGHTAHVLNRARELCSRILLRMSDPLF